VLPHGPGGLGIVPACVGVPGGMPCPSEVDAFSFGLDDLLTPNGVAWGQLHFSVDSFATGAGPVAPNVVSEFPVGDGCADVMLNTRPLPVGPLPPGPSFGHRGLMDGNGLISGSGFAYPGLGLIEPATPAPMPLNTGDNLDALDTVPPGVINVGQPYFSLDEAFPDPLTGMPNTGTAALNGFVGGDVLTILPGMAAPMVYAPAAILGLNLTPLGPDDLDALILRDNGDGIYQPSLSPYDWLGGARDMLLFSVRRGSAVIGMPDSIFGIPIEEGDILTTPLLPFLGGVSPFPGIFIAAENLGIATVRSGTAQGFFGDDLTALDSYVQNIHDCDGDGVEDVVAIANGMVADVNMNGIPDPCEPIPGCTPLVNSTGVPTVLMGMASGAAASGLHLEATSGPPAQFGYFLIGTGLASPGLLIGSGRLCLSTTAPNMIGRYNIGGSTMNSVGAFDAFGVLQNLVGTSTIGSGFDVPLSIPTIGGTIMAGSTWHFQLWHRDVPLTSNFSNSLTWMF
ncbi:MAG TPA: hypothetical protein PLJ12_04345, partial [Planctomycetota bacterium]|nr:hypothetical protein [Planctomycetota bacterium]